jgi:hypothetical protein
MTPASFFGTGIIDFPMGLSVVFAPDLSAAFFPRLGDVSDGLWATYPRMTGSVFSSSPNSDTPFFYKIERHSKIFQKVGTP